VILRNQTQKKSHIRVKKYFRQIDEKPFNIVFQVDSYYTYHYKIKLIDFTIVNF